MEIWVSVCLGSLTGKCRSDLVVYAKEKMVLICCYTWIRLAIFPILNPWTIMENTTTK